MYLLYLPTGGDKESLSFHTLATMDYAPMTIHVQLFKWTYIFLFLLGMELLGLRW